MTEIDQALAHHHAGRFDQAETLCRRILAAKPMHADALHLLGVLRAQSGRVDEGLSLIEQAIRANPAAAEYYHNLGEVLRALGRFDEAVAAYEHVIRLKPDHAAAYIGRGSALQATGCYANAAVAYRQALRLRPGSANLYNDLGIVLQQEGRLDEAVSALESARRLLPRSAPVHYNLGNALRAQGRLAEAIVAYRQALALYDQGKTHDPLGHPEGEESVPGPALVYSNLGVALLGQGRAQEAIDCFRRALAIAPRYAEAYSNLIPAMHYCPGVSPEELFAEARRWQSIHAAPLAARRRAHDSDRQPDRRLRVGYVSADFRAHSVAFFIEPLLRAHDRQKFEVHGYANVARADDITRRLQVTADHWRDLRHLGDQAAAELIRADGIDILVDLGGHTSDNRLLVFAHKPAPVQLSYLGYPATTGLDTVDYRLTDALADPLGKTEPFYCEQLIRLPQGFLCYQPAAESTAVGPPPAASSGHVTFASFNNASKVNEEVIRWWASILQAVKDSRLILKARAFADEGARERFFGLFVAHGLERERVELIGWVRSSVEHLSHYRRADIALDPFPYNGTTTTCEALWMGVPVITLAGQTHAGRVGVSLLNHVGLPELIAESPEAYVNLAVALASDLDRLRDLRQGLRDRMQRSPLMDAEGFTRSLEAAYREMWENYCKASDK